MNLLERNYQSLRLTQLGMVASVVAYAIIGEFVLRPRVHALGSTALVVVIIASSALTFAYSVRNSMVLPAEEQAFRDRDDAAAVLRWRNAIVLSLVLCEAVGLMGFLLRLLGGQPLVAWVMYAIGIGYLFLLGPRRP